MRREINEIQVREEIMWNQRSRALWLKWSDRNTKFFQATASQRWRKNWIVGLQNSEGVWQESREEILQTIVEYFETIYKSDKPTNFEANLSAVITRVSLDMNEELLADFKSEKVWSALKQMHPTKALGPNGMSPIFLNIIGILLGQKWSIVFSPF